MGVPTGYPEKILVRWNGVMKLLTWDDENGGAWHDGDSLIFIYPTTDGPGYEGISGSSPLLEIDTDTSYYLHSLVWNGHDLPYLSDTDFNGWRDGHGGADISVVVPDETVGAIAFWPATVTVYRNGEPKVMEWDGNQWGLESDPDGEYMAVYLTLTSVNYAGEDSPKTGDIASLTDGPSLEFDLAGGDGSTNWLSNINWDGTGVPVFTGRFVDISNDATVFGKPPARVQLSFIQPKPLAYCNNAIVTLAAGTNETDTVITLNEALANYDPKADYMAVFEGAAEGDHPEIVRVVTAAGLSGSPVMLGGVLYDVVTSDQGNDATVLPNGNSVMFVLMDDVLYFRLETQDFFYRIAGTMEGSTFTVTGSWEKYDSDWAAFDGVPISPIFLEGVYIQITRAQEGTTAAAHLINARLAIGVPTAQALSQMTAALTPDYLIYESPIFEDDGPPLQTGFARMFPRIDGLGNLIPSIWYTAGDDDYPEALLGGEGSYSFDPINRYLYDVNGLASLLWRQRILKDSAGSAVLNWENKTFGGGWTFPDLQYIRFSAGVLIDGSAVTKLDWLNSAMNDSTGTTSVDGENRQLIDSNGVLAVDYQNRFARFDTNGLSINWNLGQTWNHSGDMTFDWVNGTPVALLEATGGNVAAVVNNIRTMLISYGMATADSG